MASPPDERPAASRPDPRPRSRAAPARTSAPRVTGPATVEPARRPDGLTPDPRSFHVPAPGTAPPAVPIEEPGPPSPPDAPIPASSPWWRRWRWKRILAGATAVAVLLFAFCGWYTYRTYRKLERIPVSGVLTAGGGGGGGTNYLIVGTDTREGLDPDMENADVVIGGGVSGSRSDTVVLLRTSPSGNLMLPIPRDLYLPIVGTDEKNRINTAIQGGPERLIQTVQQSLGLPVDHYIEIDFAGFLDLVGALGGVDIEFDAPAFDPKSGLDIKEAGVHELDENQALAYVRSRTYTRVIDGKEVVDGRGDLGRIERQQTFLRSVMHEAGAARNPFTLARVGNAIASNLRVDDSIGFFDAIGLARKLSGLNPETVDLPTDPIRTDGGAAVLVLQQPAAETALARFR